MKNEKYLAFITLVLVFLAGCHSGHVYSPLENQVFKNTQELTKSIPKNIIRTESDDGILYHDQGLDIKDINGFNLLSQQKGEGVVIFIGKEEEIIFAGYMDFNELHGQVDTDQKSNMFIRVLLGTIFDCGNGYPCGAEIDMIGLIHGREAIFYNKEEVWKKGSLELKFDAISNLGGIEEVCQTPVSDKTVKRYLKLAAKIRKQYSNK